MVQFFLCLNITTDTPNTHSWHSVEIPSMRNPALCLVRYVQGKLHGQTIYSHVAVQIPDISLKNWRRRCRWWTRTLNWTVPDNWSCSLFSDESRFNLAYCGGSPVWYGKQPRIDIYPNVYAWSIGIESFLWWCGEPLATTVLAIWSFSMKTWMRTNMSEHCHKRSWFCRKRIWRPKASIRVSTWQCSRSTWRNELSHGWSSRTYPPFHDYLSPGP